MYASWGICSDMYEEDVDDIYLMDKEELNVEHESNIEGMEDISLILKIN